MSIWQIIYKAFHVRFTQDLQEERVQFSSIGGVGLFCIRFSGMRSEVPDDMCADMCYWSITTVPTFKVYDDGVAWADEELRLR